MKSFMRRMVRVFLIAILVFALVIVAGGIALRSPVLEVPSQGLVLSDVTIVNPGLDRRSQQTLTVQGAKINRISDSGTASPETARAHRFAGAYVLPGLIDMHVHFASYADQYLFGLLFLAHGVTTVRDTGNFDGTIWETRQRILEGEFPGPRIFACGPILDGDPPIWPGSRVVQDAAEATAAVEELAAKGASCVKVYSNLSAQALAAIREAAAQRRLPAIGHVPLAVPFEEAHLANVQHLTGVGEKRPFRGFADAWGGWRNLDEAHINNIVRTSVEQGITHTPTIVVWERISHLLDPEQLEDPTARLLPRYYRELLWSPQDGLPYIRSLSSEDLVALREAVVTIKKFVYRLHQAGVRIHVGSDTPNPFVVPGASLHEELRHLVDAGLTPEEAWVAATRVAGESLGEPKLGSLQEGASADFLIFREDPTRDLAALSTLEAVIAQGRLYPKEVLDKALARHRKYFESRFYDAVTMAIVHFRMKRMFTSRHRAEQLRPAYSG